MSTITTINDSDYQDESRTVINDNFSNLNTDKAEKSGQTFTGLINFSGTNHAGIKLISLTTAERDALTPANGMMIYNSTLGEVQQYRSSAWSSLGTFETGDLTWSTRTSKTGWLLCDGTAVSRATYSDLYALIGTTYGTGDGSTTFNLPDVKGRVLVMKDAGQTEFDTLGETGGAKTHTLTTAEMPSHTHYVGGGGGAQAGTISTVNQSDGVIDQLESSSTGDGDAHNNLQPYLVENLFIKY